MSVFKITKTLNNAYAYKNALVHNKNDFNGKNELHLKINNTVYPSIANSIEQHTIGIGNIIRTQLQLKENDLTQVTEYILKNNILNELSIKITIINKTKNIISLHESEIKDKIKEIFNNYYFYNNQSLIINYNDKNYILHIILQNEGYINNDTNIIIFSDDVTLNLIGSKLLKRDLFRDNYNFEEIGIGGLDKELVNVFRRALSTRAFKPSLIEKLGIKHVKGILLYGAPGTGKTLIARRIGSMISEIEPKIVNGPEIMDKYIGQSEKNIRELFSQAQSDYKKNGENSMLHVIIFDEIDAICKIRGHAGSHSSVNDSVVNQLLSMIDGINQVNNIFIIAMTNRKDLLDEALLRAGRIEVHIEIGLPCLEGRKQIFRIHTNKMKTNSMMDPTIDIDMLASLTDNYSGAEIESIVKNAGSRALHEQLSSNIKNIKDTDIIVTSNHFLQSIDEITPYFGNIDKTLKALLPEYPYKYTLLTESHDLCYNKINEFIKKESGGKRLKTILICGGSGTGKTTLATKIAYDNKIKYKKIINPIDMVDFDEHAKAHHMSNIVKSSYISNNSLIIIDDIEIAINYAKLDHNTIFSNKCYQTLLTLLKTPPPVKSHKLTLLFTCNDVNGLFKLIEKHFDMTFIIDKIPNEYIPITVYNLGIDCGNVKNKMDLIKYDITIKELLNYL